MAIPPIVIAHRGACGYHPEHTEAAYRAAVALGADAVEPDVVPTRDGVLVVRHENEISTTTDVAERPEFAGRRTTKNIDGGEVTGWFTEDFTWAELRTLRARERLPHLRSCEEDGRWPLLRLADVLALVRPGGATDLAVVCEIKHPTYFSSIGLPMDELLVAELATAGVRPDPQWLVVESFEKQVLRDVARRGVRSRRVYLAEATGTAFDQLAARAGSPPPTWDEELSGPGLDTLAQERVDGAPLLDGISVHAARLLSDPGAGRRLVDGAHDRDLTVYCWTLRPENAFLQPRHRTGPDRDWGDWPQEWAHVLATGVDGVFVDHPDLPRRLEH